MTTVNVINGPNLGRLGRRETQVYGSTTHDDLVAMIEQEATELGLKAVVRQTDSEADCWTGSITPSTPANRWCSMRVRWPTPRLRCGMPVPNYAPR